MDLKFLQELGKPISGKEIRELKKKEDEINRLNAIKHLLKSIYDEIIKNAKISTETQYKAHLLNFTSFRNEKFINDNSNEIIIGLQHLFRDCDIKMRTFSHLNGKLCDITDLSEEAKKCVRVDSYQTWIVIDWSE